MKIHSFLRIFLRTFLILNIFYQICHAAADAEGNRLSAISGPDRKAGSREDSNDKADPSFENRSRPGRGRHRRHSPTSNQEKSMPFFTEEEFRTEVIVPVMNIMGLGLSVFGNLYPVRQLRNDDGSPMNHTQLKSFRNEMNTFHARFSELGAHLTGVVEHSRGLRNPFEILGKKISLGRELQTQERRRLRMQQRNLKPIP